MLTMSTALPILLSLQIPVLKPLWHENQGPSLNSRLALSLSPLFISLFLRSYPLFRFTAPEKQIQTKCRVVEHLWKIRNDMSLTLDRSRGFVLSVSLNSEHPRLAHTHVHVYTHARTHAQNNKRHPSYLNFTTIFFSCDSHVMRRETKVKCRAVTN